MQLAQVEIIGLDTIRLAFDRAQDPLGPFGKAGIKLVGNMAAAGRGVLTDVFTSSSGPSSLKYNNMYWRSRMGKGPLRKGKAGYYDRRGPKHRLIHYSLKGRGATKSAHLSSYPMNLWERRKDGHSKWIMTVKLAPLVAAKGPKYIAKAEAMLATEMEKLMAGGS